MRSLESTPISGSAPTIGGLSGRDFNGGGGAQLNFLKILGIKADLMGYGTTTFTRTVNGTTISSTGNMFIYMFGPVFRVPLWRVKPFGEILFSASHTWTHLSEACRVTRTHRAKGGFLLTVLLRTMD